MIVRWPQALDTWKGQITVYFPYIKWYFNFRICWWINFQNIYTFQIKHWQNSTKIKLISYLKKYIQREFLLRKTQRNNTKYCIWNMRFRNKTIDHKWFTWNYVGKFEITLIKKTIWSNQVLLIISWIMLKYSWHCKQFNVTTACCYETEWVRLRPLLFPFPLRHCHVGLIYSFFHKLTIIHWFTMQNDQGECVDLYIPRKW